jgi:hypothetical protein
LSTAANVGPLWRKRYAKGAPIGAGLVGDRELPPLCRRPPAEESARKTNNTSVSSVLTPRRSSASRKRLSGATRGTVHAVTEIGRRDEPIASLHGRVVERAQTAHARVEALRVSEEPCGTYASSSFPAPPLPISPNSPIDRHNPGPRVGRAVRWEAAPRKAASSLLVEERRHRSHCSRGGASCASSSCVEPAPPRNSRYETRSEPDLPDTVFQR